MDSYGQERSLWKGFRKYPALRDEPFLRTAANWIRGRQLDDGHGHLWRVGDKLYDLSDFVDRHPGGSQWLQVTKGTDITEAFVSSHLNPSVEQLLAKFYVRDVATPRNSPYTLKEDDFYMTLKRRVHAHLRAHPEVRREGRTRTVRIQNGLLITFFLLLGLTAHWQSAWLAAATGLVLMMNVNCAHNFYHQRDSWRMLAWDLSLLSSYEWRITHALSHHVFTNTINDFELSDFEPLFDFRVHSGKGFLMRWAMPVLSHVLFPIFFFQEAVKRAVTIGRGQQKLRPENLLPAAQLVLLWAWTGRLVPAVFLWTVIHAVSSYWFGLVGLIAAHHHPDLFHAGDEFRYGTDWGLCQLDAVRDRSDVERSLLAVLTMYGTHSLHHLFPTLDHGELAAVAGVFRATCKEFGVDEFVAETRAHNQWQLLVGMYRQLARVDPRKFNQD